MCAAVADYGPIKIEGNKIKKETKNLNLELKENPDIISGYNIYAFDFPYIWV